MKVALLSDAHANLPALQAALDRARRWGAEEVVHLGDLVGDGPHPQEVVDLAQKRGVTALAGAHERAVAFGKAPPALKPTADWTARRLDKAALRWLASLPGQRRARLGALQALFAHGDAPPPGATGDELAARVAAARCDALVVGGSHVASVRALPGARLVIDPGSVGRPADGPEAAMVLADAAAGTFEVARVAFDVEAWRADDARARAEWSSV